MYALKVGNPAEMAELRKKYFMSNKTNTELYLTSITVSEKIEDTKNKYLSNIVIAVVNNKLRIVDYVVVPDIIEVDKQGNVTNTLSYEQIFKYMVLFKINYDIPVDHVITSHEHINNHIIITGDLDTETPETLELIDDNGFLKIETINFYKFIFDTEVQPQFDILRPYKDEIKEVKLLENEEDGYLFPTLAYIGDKGSLYEIDISIDFENMKGYAVVFSCGIDNAGKNRVEGGKLYWLGTFEYNLEDFLKQNGYLDQGMLVALFSQIVMNDKLLDKKLFKIRPKKK